jgi:hypothetical protein
MGMNTVADIPLTDDTDARAPVTRRAGSVNRSPSPPAKGTPAHAWA